MIEGGRKPLLLLRLSNDLIKFVPRRYRYKPKWAVQLKSKSLCEKALDHFDAFYKPVYGNLWPQTRLSLLSLPKHCALLNKFSSTDEVKSKLESLGTFDFLQQFKDEKFTIEGPVSSSLPSHSYQHLQQSFVDERNDLKADRDKSSNPEIDYENTSEYEERKKIVFSKLDYVLSGDSLEPFDEDVYKSDLNAFVPPGRVRSYKEQRIEDEIRAVSYESNDMEVDVVPMEPITIPEELKVFVYPPGDVSRFPQPKAFNQRTGYYLMDAASVLPVIAMNLKPHDRVLDLCAAPGGKALAMLQTLDLDEGGKLHCNDISHGRLLRLKNILSTYLPRRLSQQVDVSHMDGIDVQNSYYDKILVDVPCNSDRHVVKEEDNNLFKKSRNRERLQMMYVQINLLSAALQLCRIGGTVVYSTCTLAPAQNDGVIQGTIEKLNQRTEIKVAVEDLTPVSEAFHQTMTFYNKTRLGQLVIPCISNNFGPTYFAKLRRLQ